MSAMTEVDILNAVIDTLKKQDFVDEKNLFLCGMSQGGYVSTMLPPKDQRRYALILLCPVYVIQYQFKDQFKRKEHIPAIFCSVT